MLSQGCTSKELEKSLRELLSERFTHSLSKTIYDRIASLWHIDRDSEKMLSSIASKVVVGVFCLELLSHIDSLIRSKCGIEKLSSKDLTCKETVKDIKARLSKEKELVGLFKQVLPLLKSFSDLADTKSLECITRLAHSGDYLLSALEDMRDSDDPDYLLWLASVPHYYGKDMQKAKALRNNNRIVSRYVSNLDDFLHKPQKEQIPVELFQLEKVSSNYRINLNAHTTPRKGFFPCTSKRKTSKVKSK